MYCEVTKMLAELIYNACIDETQLFDTTRKLILDYISASYAGYQFNSKFNRAVEKIYMQIHGEMEASIFGSSKKVPVCTAAFLNAIYAHGADMDDGHRKAMGHVGANVISAIFALGDAISSSQNDVLTAIIIGYEVYTRLASSAQPGIVHRGFHSTGIVGSIACAASCSWLLGLNEEQIASAISMGATQSSGLLIVGETGQLIKPLSPGRAAETGVFSAIMAQQEIIGPMNPLESKKGWIHAMTETFDKSVLFDGFEKFDSVNECYMKPYPSCRHTHCGIEAAIKLHDKIPLAKINHIRVYTYENAINLAGVISYPKNFDEAKFSIYYTLACALYYGDFGFRHLQPDKIDKEVYSIISKIELTCEPCMEDIKKGIRGARVEIEDIDGNRFEEIVLRPKGEPENPFSNKDISKKLKQCAESLITHEQQKILINRITSLGGSEPFEFSHLFFRKE